MESVLSSGLTFVGIGAGIFALISLSLIAFGKGKHPEGGKLGFGDLLSLEYDGLPELQTYTARDGAALPYRYYPAETSDVLILLHGSGWHSRYLLPLAKFLSSSNLAQVYTPDLRGHGENPQKRGDIDYIGQYEDDLADLIEVIRKQTPDARIIMSGHSSGGGLALRFAGSQHGNQAEAYLLLAPYIAYNAPTVRPNAGWAAVHTGRIIGLTMLNGVGIKVFNGLPVIDFNMPREARDGTETLQYTFRLNTGYAVLNYKAAQQAFANIHQPLLLIVGSEEELFIPEEYEPMISPHTKADIHIVDGLSHMGVAVSDRIHGIIRDWFDAI